MCMTCDTGRKPIAEGLCRTNIWVESMNLSALTKVKGVAANVGFIV